MEKRGQGREVKEYHPDIFWKFENQNAETEIREWAYKIENETRECHFKIDIRQEIESDTYRSFEARRVGVQLWKDFESTLENDTWSS